jgi:hypothetical protein
MNSSSFSKTERALIEITFSQESSDSIERTSGTIQERTASLDQIPKGTYLHSTLPQNPLGAGATGYSLIRWDAANQ